MGYPRRVRHSKLAVSAKIGSPRHSLVVSYVAILASGLSVWFYVAPNPRVWGRRSPLPFGLPATLLRFFSDGSIGSRGCRSCGYRRRPSSLAVIGNFNLRLERRKRDRSGLLHVGDSDPSTSSWPWCHSRLPLSMMTTYSLSSAPTAGSNVPCHPFFVCSDPHSQGHS